MKKVRKKRKIRKHIWGNRMALVGITAVVLSLAFVVNLKTASLKTRELEYQARLEKVNLLVEQESERAEELAEEQIYVQTKQYIEKVAKEKLGLVSPNEILLKPSNKE